MQLYWNKRTNTDTASSFGELQDAAVKLSAGRASSAGAQFTYFNGTKVHILTQLLRQLGRARASTRTPQPLNTQFTCFTGIKVQILMHTDAAAAAAGRSEGEYAYATAISRIQCELEFALDASLQLEVHLFRV